MHIHHVYYWIPCRSDDKKKKSTSKKRQRLLWKIEDFSENVPLTVNNRVILSCKYGKAYKRKQKPDTVSHNHKQEVYLGISVV